MRSILTELYFGNIGPNTQSFDRYSALGKAMQVVADNEAKLIELLDGKEKKLFLEFVNAQMEVNGCTSLDKFIFGFKFGAQVMLEAMGKVEFEE